MFVIGDELSFSAAIRWLGERGHRAGMLPAVWVPVAEEVAAGHAMGPLTPPQLLVGRPGCAAQLVRAGDTLIYDGVCVYVADASGT